MLGSRRDHLRITGARLLNANVCTCRSAVVGEVAAKTKPGPSANVSTSRAPVSVSMIVFMAAIAALRFIEFPRLDPRFSPPFFPRQGTTRDSFPICWIWRARSSRQSRRDRVRGQHGAVRRERSSSRRGGRCSRERRESIRIELAYRGDDPATKKRSAGVAPRGTIAAANCPSAE